MYTKKKKERKRKKEKKEQKRKKEKKEWKKKKEIKSYMHTTFPSVTSKGPKYITYTNKSLK